MRNLWLKVFVGVITASLATSTALASSFSDVANDDALHAEAIDFLREAGVVNGYEDGTFRPVLQINRAELMKMLVEGLGMTPDEQEFSNCFDDVKEEWFAKYVCYAKDLGWVKGFDDGTFRPGNYTNKAEALKMVMEAQEIDQSTTDCGGVVLSDADKNNWYASYLCGAARRGLLEDGEGTSFAAGNEITRGQVAEKLFRSMSLQTLKREKFEAEFVEEMKSKVIELKNERAGIQREVELFRSNLEESRQQGMGMAEFRDARKSFWDMVKELQKNNRAELAAGMRNTNSTFRVLSSLEEKTANLCSQYDLDVNGQFCFNEELIENLTSCTPYQGDMFLLSLPMLIAPMHVEVMGLSDGQCNYKHVMPVIADVLETQSTTSCTLDEAQRKGVADMLQGRNADSFSTLVDTGICTMGDSEPVASALLEKWTPIIEAIKQIFTAR